METSIFSWYRSQEKAALHELLILRRHLKPQAEPSIFQTCLIIFRHLLNQEMNASHLPVV